MREQDLEELRRVSLFADLSDQTLRKLTAGALLQKFPDTVTLFTQGDLPDFLHVVLDGAVQLSASTGGGREAVVEVLRPVECFILAAALTNTPYLMSARVLGGARILLLPADVFREQLIADPALALTMMASLAGQYRLMVRQIKSLKLRTATQRLGCYLLSLFSEDATEEICLPYRKRVVASQLGVTPEALSRALATLCDHGILVQGRAIKLRDRTALTRYCMPDTLIDDSEGALRIAP